MSNEIMGTVRFQLGTELEMEDCTEKPNMFENSLSFNCEPTWDHPALTYLHKEGDFFAILQKWPFTIFLFYALFIFILVL